MKLAGPVLILASSAFALPSYGFPIDRLNVHEPADIGFAMPKIGFAFPDIVFTKSTGHAPADLAEKPEFPKLVDARLLIRAAARKHRVPEALVKSIVAAESNFNCDAVSAKGAIGLMQLMPQTAQQFGADPTIPEQNIDAGTRYLRFLMSKYRKHGNSLSRVIAAYNAGPGAVDRYHGVPPFRETRCYVVRVMTFLRQFRKELG